MTCNLLYLAVLQALVLIIPCLWLVIYFIWLYCRPSCSSSRVYDLWFTLLGCTAGPCAHHPLFMTCNLLYLAVLQVLVLIVPCLWLVIYFIWLYCRSLCSSSRVYDLWFTLLGCTAGPCAHHPLFMTCNLLYLAVLQALVLIIPCLWLVIYFIWLYCRPSCSSSRVYDLWFTSFGCTAGPCARKHEGSWPVECLPVPHSWEQSKGAWCQLIEQDC